MVVGIHTHTHTPAHIHPLKHTHPHTHSRCSEMVVVLTVNLFSGEPEKRKKKETAAMVVRLPVLDDNSRRKTKGKQLRRRRPFSPATRAARNSGADRLEVVMPASSSDRKWRREVEAGGQRFPTAAACALGFRRQKEKEEVRGGGLVLSFGCSLTGDSLIYDVRSSNRNWGCMVVVLRQREEEGIRRKEEEAVVAAADGFPATAATMGVAAGSREKEMS